MIRVHADGDGRHRLEDESGRDVGWIHGRAVGLRGMGNEGRAMIAVGVLWPVFDSALRRHYFGFPSHEVSIDGLRLVHDGAYEWISDRQRPLARLHRPRAGQAHASFAVEFVLPSYANEGVIISVAQVMATALQAHLAGEGTMAGLAPSTEPAVLGA